MSDATRVAIIGLGAVGGSAALSLLSRGAVPRGFSPESDDLRKAADAGLAIAASIDSAVRDCDLALLAVPLDSLAPVAAQVVAAAPASATILHASSLQRPLATGMIDELGRRVIGTHPLAGTEHAGFSAARADLFQGATVFVESGAHQRTRDDAELFWSMAGAARIEYLAAAEHDDLMSVVSHTPQLVATALSAAFGYANVPGARLGSGGRDMTRLGASSWSMWKPLLAATPGRTLALLETVENELRQMRESLAAGDLAEIGVTWEVARSWQLAAERARVP